MTTKDFQTKRPLAIFLSYFRPHRRLFALDIICAFMISLVDLAFPLISRTAMYQWLPQQQYRTFFIVMGIVVLAFVLRSFLCFVVGYWGHTFGIRVEADIRRDLFRHMQELGFDFYDRNRTGQLMSRLTSDLFEVTELAHHGPEDLFISAVTIVGALIVMFSIQWRLALVVSLIIPIFMVVVMYRRRQMSAASRAAKQKTGVINAEIESGLSGVRTTKAFGESTVSKILELVENSSSHKSRSENFISKFARIYTPAVCIGALVLAVLPPVVRLVMGLSGDWGIWVYRALTFLVISCPCALVISIPLSFFAGLGGASRAGVLVKGSNYLETLSKTRVVVFDKTGTLTQGVFDVTDVHHNTMPQKKVLEYAALAECASSHPISKSLQRAYGGEIDRHRVTDVQEISGNGITAKVDGTDVAVGNSKLMDRLGIAWHDCHSVGTIIHLAIDGQYAGHIVISDVVKPHAKEAIAALKQAGVEKTVMLTGDIRRVADHVAGELCVDEVHSELLPADKVAQVERLLSNADGKLAFVGDGINDAPVLSRADIGIAMGAMGSDAAIEAADVVLMDDDPLKISKAIRISRKCLRIVYENIVFALGIKGLCLVLGAMGIANMWAAIFADVGVMVIAVLNAIRALQVKNL